MRVASSFQRYNDFDQQAEQLSGFERMHQQLDCGPYTGELLACVGDGMGFFTEQSSRRLAKQGAGPSGTVSAVLLHGSPNCTLSNGTPFSMDDVQLVGPDGAYEAVADANLKTVIFSVSLDSQAAIPFRLLATRQKGRVRRVSDRRLSGQFRNAAAQILQSWDDASRSVSLPQSTVHGLMLELLTSPSAADGSSHSLIQVYRAARDIMLDAVREPLSMAEIASRVGTSRRTLEKAFDCCVSVSPGRFQKLLRLNNARRLLQNGQHSVTQAATSSGFHNLGRFSSEYQDLFDELPSDTARRARVLLADPD